MFPFRSAFFLLLLPLTLLTASCALHLPEPGPGGEFVTMRVPSSRTPKPTAETVPIYILADSIHTGLVFDQQWLEESGYVFPAHFGKHQWVTMSWGNETAYRQRRWLNLWQVFRALATASPSVMEIIPMDWKVEEVCRHQRIYLNEVPRDKGPALVAFLNGCGVKGEDGHPITVDTSSWGKGYLIKCPDNYSYYFPRICNVWTTQCLTKCGFSFNTTTSLLANGVIRQATRDNGFKKIWDGDNAPIVIENPSTKTGT